MTADNVSLSVSFGMLDDAILLTGNGFEVLRRSWLCLGLSKKYVSHGECRTCSKYPNQNDAAGPFVGFVV